LIQQCEINSVKPCSFICRLYCKLQIFPDPHYRETMAEKWTVGFHNCIYGPKCYIPAVRRTLFCFALVWTVICSLFEYSVTFYHVFLFFIDIARLLHNKPRYFYFFYFYSASALLAMQSAVLTRAILSVCLSVSPSVTFRCFVQTNKDTIVRF